MDHKQLTWQAPPPRLRIADSETHVWLVPAERTDPAAAALLSVTELERASRLRRERSRIQYTATQCMLRRLLGGYLNLSPDSVELKRTSNGKPYVDPRHGSTLGFNVSHSGSWALIAFARGKEIGVDLEAHRPLDAMNLAQRFFCDSEALRLADIDEDVRNNRFFDLWTAKEALAKAMGTGIAGTLKRFEVVTEPEMGWRDVSGGAESLRWSLHALPAPANHSAALAIERGLGQLRLFSAE